jgi:hypothetical protein
LDYPLGRVRSFCCEETAGSKSVELSQLKPIRETVKTTAVNFNHATGGAGGADGRWPLSNLTSMTGSDSHWNSQFRKPRKRCTTACGPKTLGLRIPRKCGGFSTNCMRWSNWLLFPASRAEAEAASRPVGPCLERVPTPVTEPDRAANEIRLVVEKC